MASWPHPRVEVTYVIPLYGVSRGLNLNLSSVGGRSLKLTDYYRAEARRNLPDRAKTEAETMRQSRGRGSKVETKARPGEAEARLSQLKKLPRGRLEPRQMPRGLHPWIYLVRRHCHMLINTLTAAIILGPTRLPLSNPKLLH